MNWLVCCWCIIHAPQWFSEVIIVVTVHCHVWEDSCFHTSFSVLSTFPGFLLLFTLDVIVWRTWEFSEIEQKSRGETRTKGISSINSCIPILRFGKHMITFVCHSLFTDSMRVQWFRRFNARRSHSANSAVGIQPPGRHISQGVVRY